MLLTKTKKSKSYIKGKGGVIQMYVHKIIVDNWGGVFMFIQTNLPHAGDSYNKI